MNAFKVTHRPIDMIRAQQTHQSMEARTSKAVLETKWNIKLKRVYKHDDGKFILMVQLTGKI